MGSNDYTGKGVIIEMATFIEQNKRGEKLHRVDEGDTFTTDHHGRPIHHVVAESCGGEAGSGVWYCVTHDQSFRSNWDKDSHIDRGDHLLAWACLEHGPEVP